ncbi:hypothetical protein [Vibrio crassostreae]|uniref:hypothetical protein n=1 Tax=Vibrio crassostreae TaxID=246167 RepID=UPI001B30D980|nr:hypothetical protein [Vibrio crassostreae]
MNLKLKFAEGHSGRNNTSYRSLEMLQLLERVSVDIVAATNFTFDEVKGYKLLERIIKGYPLGEAITLTRARVEGEENTVVQVVEGADTIMTLQALFRPEMLNMEPLGITIEVNGADDVVINIDEVSRGTMPWLKLMRSLEERGVSDEVINHKVASIPDQIWYYRIQAAEILNERVVDDLKSIIG